MRRIVLATAILAALPTLASAELGFYGWGLRLGLGDDPDQVIVGFQQDFGEFVPRVGFQPSFEIGSGDDRTVVAATFPVHYRFEVISKVKPYVGGGVQVAWIDRDLRRGGSESEIEISPTLTGGAAWPIHETGEVFLELSLGGGDSHSAKLMVGWMFRAR